MHFHGTIKLTGVKRKSPLDNNCRLRNRIKIFGYCPLSIKMITIRPCADL